jgi:aspartate/methionine/tyrosine aminotransferase
MSLNATPINTATKSTHAPWLPFELERYFHAVDHRINFSLTSSGFTPWTLQRLLSVTGNSREFYESLNQLTLDYPPHQGSLFLRESISKLYFEDVSEIQNQILVTQGGMEGIYCVLNALLSPDDHVISHFPVYPGLWLIPQNKGCGVSFWQGDLNTHWLPNLAELETLYQPNTKALIVNFPHNPTGALPDVDWWQRLFDWAEAKRIYIISDEVYRWGEHDPAKRLPPAFLMSPWGISISSLSKAFGLAGLRLGWVGCQNPEVLQSIAQQKDFTTLTPNVLSEWTAAWVLQHEEVLLNEAVDIALQQKVLLESHLNQWNTDHPSKVLNWHSPKAGALMSVILPEGNCAKTLADGFLTQTGGLVLPSHLYYPSSIEFQAHEFLRLSFGHQTMAEHYPLFFNFIKTNII